MKNGCRNTIVVRERSFRQNDRNMREILATIASGKAQAVQVRYHCRYCLRIGVENGRVTQLTATDTSGVGIRVLQNGIWGFSTTSDTSLENLKKTFTEAKQAALSGQGKQEEFLLAGEPVTGNLTVQQTKPLSSVSLEEKLSLVRKTEEKMRQLSSKIVSTAASYEELLDTKIIVTSSGANVSYQDTKADFRALAFASDGTRLEYGRMTLSATGGWEELFRHVKPEAVPEEAVRSAVEKLTAEPAPAGLYTVVLHPSLVGILAHEAIGHTVEADFVLAGSIAGKFFQKKVAAEQVSIVDDPLPAKDTAASGVLLVDDEGNRTRVAVIIENGYLRGYLHDSRTAWLFHTKNTGNARAFTYRDEPLIRMRNTYVLPGVEKPEEIIAGTPSGLYLKGLGQSGQADANAEFMFGVDQAWWIRDGKLASPVTGVTISGNAFEVLSSVDKVGCDFLLDSGAGYCGKHQPAKVDAGGPHLRCQVKVGGNL